MLTEPAHAASWRKLGEIAVSAVQQRPDPARRRVDIFTVTEVRRPLGFRHHDQRKPIFRAKSFYSLSIINRPSELLTRRDRVAATKALAVTLDVNLSRTSLGAGLRAVRPERSFRDLSTTIDAHDD